MTPQTVHWIAQEIRHQRALLTVEETWLQQQPKTETVMEGFRRINFWRQMYKLAEEKITASETGDVERVAS